MKQERKEEKKKRLLTHFTVQSKCFRQREIRKFSNDFYLIQIALRFSPCRLRLAEQSDS